MDWLGPSLQVAEMKRVAKGAWKGFERELGKMRHFFQKHWKIIIFCFIILFASSLRFRNLDKQEFKGDQARDCNEVRGLLIDHKLITKGPIADPFPTLGPAYYYIITPPMLISLEPEGVYAWIALLNVLAIILCFKFVKELFDNKKIALLASLFYAVSLVGVIYSKLIWSPSILPLFTILLFYSALKVFKGQNRYLMVLLPVLAVIVQIHASALAFVPVLLLLYLIYRPKIKLKLKSKYFASGLFLFVLIIIPAIYAALSTPPLPSHMYRPLLIDEKVLGTVSYVSTGWEGGADILQISSFFLLLIFSASIVFLGYTVLKRRRKTEFSIMLLFLWFLIPLLALNYSYVGSTKYLTWGVQPHHVLWLIPLPFILTAFIAYKVIDKMNRVKFLIFGLIGFVIIGQATQTIIHLSNENALTSPRDTRSLAKFIIADSGGDFNVLYSSGNPAKPHGREIALEYFLLIYGGYEERENASHQYIILDYIGDVPDNFKTLVENLPLTGQFGLIEVYKVI